MRHATQDVRPNNGTEDATRQHQAHDAIHTRQARQQGAFTPDQGWTDEVVVRRLNFSGYCVCVCMTRLHERARRSR